VEEAAQQEAVAVEAAASETKRAVKGAVAVGAEIADHGSLVPRPSPFDRIELRGVGR